VLVMELDLGMDSEGVRDIGNFVLDSQVVN